jgi:hypothetical protein
MVAGVPYLLAGKEDSKSDQIKFRLSDCMFEYGAFREEPADKFEAFLVVGSIRGDTLSFSSRKAEGWGSSRGILMPCRKSCRASIRKITVSAASLSSSGLIALFVNMYCA